MKSPNDIDLLIAQIKLELKTCNLKIAQSTLSNGLKKHNSSSKLWQLAVDSEPYQTRLKKAFEGL